MFEKFQLMRAILISIVIICPTAWGTVSRRGDCETILEHRTLAGLVAAATDVQKTERQALPFRTFADPVIDQSRVESGLVGPRAIMDLNPPHVKFQSLQAPWAETSSVIKLDEPKWSLPVRVETNFNQSKLSTTVYLSLPKPIRKKTNRPNQKKQFLIGEEYRDTGVILWLHGGGTPTATGVNAMSVGFELGKREIPIFAPDLPGHGNGPIYPFTSNFEIWRYLVELAKDNIHPDVPVTIMGHSLGGQFAISFYLNYPRFNLGNLKVAAIISLAPPADMALGGDANARLQADRRVESCFSEWESRVAESDWDFIKNVVENGKTGPVPAVFCNISAVDYAWKKPTDRFERPPMAVIVGENDGLVFTGREKTYVSFLNELVGPENVIVLPPGRSHKSDPAVNGGLVRTGHNIFDRFLDASARSEMKEFLGADRNRENIQEVYARMAFLMEKWSGRKLPKLPLKGDDNVTPEGILELFYRKYANYLPFREFIKSYVFRDFRKTPQFGELLQRREALEKFLRQGELIVKKAEQKTEEEFSVEKKAINEKYKARSIEGANRELSLTRTAERELELRQFIDAANAVKQSVIANQPDPKVISAERVALIPKPEGVLDLADAEAKLANRGLVENDKVLRKKLEGYVLTVRQTIKTAEKELGVAITNELELKVRFPSGVKTIADAEFELKADLSPDRKAQLRAYLEKIEELNRRLVEAKRKAVAEALAALRPPFGLMNYSAAERELSRLSDLMDFKLVTEVETAGVKKGTGNLVNVIIDAEASLVKQNSLISENLAKVRETKEVRAALRGLFDSALAKIADPKLATLQKTRDEALAVFTEANKRYDTFAGDRVTTLFDAGKLDHAAVQDIFADLKPFAEQYMRARKFFMQKNRELLAAKIEAALAGDYGQEIQLYAFEIWGVDGKGGVERTLKELMEARDKSFSIKVTLEHDLFKAKKKYIEMVPGIYQIVELPIAPLLDLDYDDLVSRMLEPTQGKLLLDAMRAALKEFSDIWDNRDMPAKKGADIN